MHVHRRFLGSLAAAALAALGAQARPVQAQTIPSTRWVISSLHPDPTPPLGAPDCEYIALYAMSDSLTGGGACRTDGLVLSWNGHERELPDGAWPAGSTVVVHRAADSLHLAGWAPHRIGLSSWPALVNGGALVSLSDSGGVLLDAVLDDERALAGGGRPLLRKDPSACGAGVNFEAWAAPMNPFDPAGIPVEPEGLAWTSGALLSGAASFERLIVRGPGHLEWRLPGPVDPRSMLQAHLWIGGVRLTDLAVMFEGALRTVQEMPVGWWSSWFLLALGLGLLHRAQPAHRRWMWWAWTDHRLLVLELADRQRVQLTWVLSCVLAGLALSLSMVGMGSVSESAIPSWPWVWKGMLVWALLLFLRWVTALLWDLHAGDHRLGDAFFLNHRLHMESAAWLIAPVGFVCSTWGPEASRFGLWVAMFLWVVGWLLRQQRGVSQNPLFRKQPLHGILYLCGLEILPVAVLFRIWQG